MYRRLAVLAGGLVLLCAMPLAAQDAALDQMYGSGVHAYFSQDHRQAYDHFTAAIDAGTTDPRCYYFRGLCYLKLGREEEAEMDFEQAARLEAQDVNKFYDVGRALERIQGSTRLTIERYRAEARMEALKREEKLRRERYGKLREAEQRVLETQAEAAPATPLEVPAPPGPPTATDPFGLRPTQETAIGPDDVPEAEPAEGAPAPAEPPAVPAAPAPEDPFSVVPAPAGMDQEPVAGQPAEQPAAEPPAEAPGEAPAAPDEPAQPGAPAPAADDPFGLGVPAPEQPPAPAEPAAPAEAEPAAPEDDPFAPAAPADDPFAPAAPAAAEPAAPADAEPAAPADAEPAAPADAEPAAPAADENPFMEEDAAKKEGAEEAPAPAGANPFPADPFAEDPAAE